MKLPRDLPGRAVVRALQRLGFQFAHQAGSHAIMKKGVRTVVVPQHKAIKPGTLKSLIEQAGITLEELVRKL